MKRSSVICILLITALIFAQTDAPNKITKSKFTAATGACYCFDNADPNMEEITYSLPQTEWKVEIDPNENLKIYFNTALGYSASRLNGDHNELVFSADPMLKYTFSGAFFIKGGLPLSFGTYSLTSGRRVLIKDFSAAANLGFDNRDIEIRKLTPWDNFEDGMALYGVFETDIVFSVDNNPEEELPSYAGLEAAYAYPLENGMVKGNVSYRYQLNENYLGRINERGGMNSTLIFGLLYAKDLNRNFNFNAEADFMIIELEEQDAAENGAYNYLGLGTELNYYPNSVLRFIAGVGATKDLTTDDAELIYGLKFGIEAAIDFLRLDSYEK